MSNKIIGVLQMKDIYIPQDHKELLFKLGLNEKDLTLFDGIKVKYEYDREKGVRIYDPFYLTSYNEYIDVDGWSAWSSEEDTFMQDIINPAIEKVREIEEISERPSEEDIKESLRKKFQKIPKDE